MRLVKTYKERGVTAKVYWDALHMEYRVCFEYDGIGHIEEADYFTNDRQDAFDTARYQIGAK